jgi:AcrR family transcriptional regulator
MPARPGLSPERLVQTALEIVDETGPEALTLARVAERSGVAAPSLYKHVNGLPQLHRLLRLRVLGELGDALREATIGRAGEQAIRALATAYRGYLRAHPHRHALVEVAATDPVVRAASDRVAEVALAAVRGYGLSGSAEVHAVRCVRAAVHGFVRLEAIGGFGLPEDVDATFDHLLAMLVRGVSTIATKP